MLDSFIQEQNNQVVSVDRVPAHAGQSVQLIAAWCLYIGLPYQWANPAEWWDDEDINFSDHWRKVIYDPDNPEIRPKTGDIIVFDSDLPGTGNSGHLTIFKGAINELSWIGFDASWGGRSAHLQSHSWAYVLGWYTPVNPNVVEQPLPTPIASEVPSEGYEAISHEAKLVTLKLGAPLYNLNDVSFESFRQNPLSRAGAEEEVAIAATAKHRLGGLYLMPDNNQPYGYSIEDCEGYEDLVMPQLTPGTITQDPMIKVHKLPEKPYVAPSSEIFAVLFPINYYHSMSDARYGNSPVDKLQPNRYYIHKRLHDMISLTTEPGKAAGVWINPHDLEQSVASEQPADTKWRTSFTAFKDEYKNVSPRWFAGIENGVVTDLEQNRKDLLIQKNQPILVAGWFQGPDGEWYGRPDDAAQMYLWYGVRKDNLKPYTPPKPQADLDNMQYEDDPTIETIGGPVVVSIDEPTFLRRKMTTILNPGLNKVFDVVNKNKEKIYANLTKRP